MTPTQSEVEDLPLPCDELQAPKRPLNARTRLFALRAVSFACLDASSMEELEERSSHRLGALLKMIGGPDRHALPTAPATLARMLDATCDDLAGLMPESDPSTLDGLGTELGKALRFNDCEIRILQLALHAHASLELRRCLNLVGDVEDVGMSQLLEHILAIDHVDARAALHRDSPLFMMDANQVSFCNRLPADFLRLTQRVSAVLKRSECTADEVLSVFFRLSPPPRLSLGDFDGAGPDVALMIRYLGKVLATERQGVNILLHGKPGTGKTELVRAVAKAFGATLQEVPSVDEDGDPLPAWRRLTAYSAAQESTRQRPGNCILFDEVEDIFPHIRLPDGFHNGGHAGPGDRNKGWLTQVLETNPRPTVWVSNVIEQMDPAFIRRFDMVVELTGPDRSTRTRLIGELFQDLPVAEASLSRIGEQSHFAPGHLERMASVLRVLGPADSDEATRLLEQLSLQTLKALQVVPPANPASLLPYRLDCVNADCELHELGLALAKMPSARPCLYGPPGTGKTEWARQLATRLGKNLLVRRASDLLGKYVGETEKAIRDAFDEATRSGAVLLMDEADSLIRSRENARAGWEVSMVNEMLTAMERYQGVFIASTNLVHSLDPASARRFDFKVKFSELSQKQAESLFRDLMGAMGLAPQEAGLSPWSRFRGVTPGDFANVFRQARLFPSRHDAASLTQLVAKEVGFRSGEGRGPRIGFV